MNVDLLLNRYRQTHPPGLATLCGVRTSNICVKADIGTS